MTEAAPATPYRKSRRADERVTILSAPMDLVRPEEVWAFVARKVAAGQRAIIANHNLHSLYLVRRDPELARFFALADLIEVDSTPILAWARATARRGKGFHRCTYLDWRDAFWPEAVKNGWRVFYLGGAPGVAQTAAGRLSQRYPGLKLEVRHGYFDMTQGSAEAEAVNGQIAVFAPHILLVGMGMPRQEAWIVRNHDRVPPCAVLSVGAAFDYEAGVQRAAPRLMGRLGVEWAFRLIADPKRLFTRYLIEPWFLIPAALRDLVHAATAKKPADRRKPNQDRRAGRVKDWSNPGRRGSDLRGRPS